MSLLDSNFDMSEKDIILAKILSFELKHDRLKLCTDVNKFSLIVMQNCTQFINFEEGVFEFDKVGFFVREYDVILCSLERPNKSIFYYNDFLYYVNLINIPGTTKKMSLQYLLENY